MRTYHDLQTLKQKLLLEVITHMYIYINHFFCLCTFAYRSMFFDTWMSQESPKRLLSGL